MAEVVQASPVTRKTGERPSGGLLALYGWYVVILLFLGHLVSFLDRAIVIVALEPLKHAFALNDLALGALYGTVFVVLYSLVSLPLGRWADRTNRVRMITVGLSIWVVCTAFFGLAHSPAVLFLSRLGVGLGEAALVPAAMSLIAAYVPRRYLGRAVAFFAIGPTYGSAAAFLLGGWVLAEGVAVPGWASSLGFDEPWRLLLLYAALPGAALILLMAFTVREPPRAVRAAVARTAVLADPHLRRHWKAYLIYALAAGAAVFVLQAVQTWIPTYFIRTFHVPVAKVSSAMGVATLVMTPISAMTSGWLLDRLEAGGVPGAAGRMLAGAMVLVTIPMLVTALAPTATIAAIAYLIVKLCLGFAVPTLMGGLQVMTPSGSRGAATAFVMMALTLIGVGLGPPAAGALSEYVFAGPRAVGLSLLAITILSGLTAAGLMWSNRRRAALAAADARLEDAALEEMLATAKSQ